ncbi:ImcF-related family protein [Erwinia sp.]|uniref:ImcF-related family protein n=1 Tax=Erwinia citreus TaxID=558 RepID=UPI003C7740E8
MSDAKSRMLIGPAVGIIILLIVISAFLLWAWPESIQAATGIPPLTGIRILTFAAILTVIMLLAGWVLEALMRRSGKSGVQLNWARNKQQAAQSPGSADSVDTPESSEQQRFSAQQLGEHLTFRYGHRWHRRVTVLLVNGSVADTDALLPGLSRNIWLEGESFLLVYAGEAKAEPDASLLAELKLLRPRCPADGVLMVLNAKTLPGEAECDAIARSRQKTDCLMGWQLPVWLRVLQKTEWAQEIDLTPVALITGAQASSNDLNALIQALLPGLRHAGTARVVSDSRNNWHLNMASQLEDATASRLTRIFHSLTEEPAACRVSGVFFSPQRKEKERGAHVLHGEPLWDTLAECCMAVRPRKITTDWLRIGRFSLVAVLALWCAGTLLSLAVNRTQIYQAHETARMAADRGVPLSERLQNQLMLQQTIARLQHRQAMGAPWYTRFGLNQDASTLASLWPLYAVVNNQLMRDMAAQQLSARLQEFVRLPPASSARQDKTRQAYDWLKGYLMLSRPDKADAKWLAQHILILWPQRLGVTPGSWQSLSPKLTGFWAQNVPRHPEWKITPDPQLVSTVRQILLKQIGQRNAESGLYQEMLKQVASNWPDLTLADMTGDTDAAPLFHSDETVPGMFTRQAWEEQVRQAIEDVVSARRNEIDWVLTDKSHQPGSEVSPEALKMRLTERYFTDFGNVWLNMINSIQWVESTSLSEAIGQLNQLADVRQSPLVALMNTLAWQGKTGQKSEALADTLVDSAKQLIIREKKPRQMITQAQGPQGPLDAVFGPLTSLMEGKDGTGSNGNLSFQSWLARVTQVRLKLQQVTSAPDPQAMAQMLAQTVFQGKSIDITETRNYSSLVAASLGQEWSGFGQALFVQPLDLAWRQVLAPAAGSLNERWQDTIVSQWSAAFSGRYPFKSTGSDASLPLLAQFMRGDTGRITAFLNSNLGGILHQEGSRWVVDPSSSQGLRVSSAFLQAINELGAITDIVFAQGDAGLRFELMARPSQDVARMQLTVEGEKMDYFNQMNGWQSFRWPGETHYPGANLNWQSTTSSGMQLYDNIQGNWGWIRLLEKAKTTVLDSSRTQLVWPTTDGKSLKLIMRSELGDGPLVLLKLRGFTLPQNIFDVEAGSLSQGDEYSQ